MAEQPDPPHSHILELLRRFGLHPFTRILQPKVLAEGEKTAEGTLQPAGEPLPPLADETTDQIKNP